MIRHKRPYRSPGEYASSYSEREWKVHKNGDKRPSKPTESKPDPSTETKASTRQPEEGRKAVAGEETSI